MIVTQGQTNVSVPFYFVDDVGGTKPGEPTTGLLFSDIETGGSASYQRQGAARVDITAITLASASATHADGGFILVDDTNMKGVYRFDVPDLAFAAGVDFVLIYLLAATGKNTITRPIKIDLTTVDLRDGVRGGMTAIPNAVADAAGGLPISDGGGLDLDAILVDTNSLNDTKVPDTISLAAIKAEVNAAIDTAIAELGVAAPTATPTLRTGMMLMYMALRDKFVTQTSGTDALEIHNDAGTLIAKKLITDDGSDYTEAKMTSG